MLYKTNIFPSIYDYNGHIFGGMVVLEEKGHYNYLNQHLRFMLHRHRLITLKVIYDDDLMIIKLR